ncbi:MAG: DUF2442 domain-containing protein [Bacteroidetes bacterium]|nr:DUF2442 domain-containing protein [Bacteroidota bacterium]
MAHNNKNISIEGFWNKKVRIDKIDFYYGKLIVYLSDKRIIIVPISYFPSIKKLDTKERKKWFILGNGFTFENSNEVYHLEPILGNYKEYAHEKH